MFRGPTPRADRATATVALASSSAALFALCVHLGAEARAMAPDGRALPASWALLPAVGASLLAFAVLSFPPWRATDLLGFGVHYVLLGGAVAWAVEVFEVYAVAFAVAPLVLYPLYLSHQRGLLRYRPDTAHFVLSRGALYATLRSFGAVLVARTSAPAAAARLLPVTLATLETMAMAWWPTSSSSYEFVPRSVPFVVYSVLKTAAFLALPVLEEALVHRR